MRLLSNDPLPLAVSKEDFARAVPWVEADDYDMTIEAYLNAAQEVVEVASRRPLTERSVEVEFELDAAGGFRRWWFPIAPTKEITAITAFRPLVGEVIIAVDQVSLHRGFEEPQLWFSDAALSIANPNSAQSVRVQVIVGYAEGKQPPALKQAIILIVKEWFDAGVSLGDLGGASLSFGVKSLIKQQRYCRPHEFG